MLKPILPAVLVMLCLTPAFAQRASDRALIVGNENYADAADITAADAVLEAQKALETAGFSVVSGQDADTSELRALLSALLDPGDGAGRLVIVLSGHFAQSGRQTWFLGTDATLPDLAGIEAVGVSLTTVLEIAAGAAGGALVVLGTEGRRLPLGAGLEPGIGRVEVPQGVTLIKGDAARVAEFLAEAVPQRGQSLAAMLDRNPDLTADGFISTLVPFRPALAGAIPDPAPSADAEAIFWESTRVQGTLTAFDAYLKRYPDGRFAADAKAEIARIKAIPFQAAREGEDALALSRDDRRAIQRALALVGHDPGGIDGLFGKGSRTAIAGWQKKDRYETTAYLTREQIVRLTEQAEDRAAALEAEAAARQATLDRADRDFWQQTGAEGDEAGLRAYLQRYPDGIFAEVATERLARFEAAARDQAETADSAAWDLARRDESLAGYQDYLDAFPDGAFADEAKARMAILRSAADQDASRAEWAATEAVLGLGPEARRVIETRLDALGLKPGPVDGQFDDRTRRAIRRFQESRQMETTGYLDQAATVALLAGAVLRLGD
ncbi:MAG: hypothetical protein RIT14_1263 [Pseudomonadota bacterium]